jgi:hypothetical protein
MANEKQVRTGEVKGVAAPGSLSAPLVAPSAQVVGYVAPPALTPDQLLQLQHAILVGTIVGGYLAAGKLIGSNDSKRQVEQAIAFAKEKLL